MDQIIQKENESKHKLEGMGTDKSQKPLKTTIATGKIKFFLKNLLKLNSIT